MSLSSHVLDGARGRPAAGVRVRWDHLADGRTEVLDGAPWRWVDEDAAALQPRILEELKRL